MSSGSAHPNHLHPSGSTTHRLHLAASRARRLQTGQTHCRRIVQSGDQNPRPEFASPHAAGGPAEQSACKAPSDGIVAHLVRGRRLICSRAADYCVNLGGMTLAVPGATDSWHSRNTLSSGTVSYTHLRAHETDSYLVCRLLLEKK